MLKFLITLTLATAIILVVGLFCIDTLPGYFYQTLIFLFVSTGGMYRFLLRTKQQRPDFFVQIYLATLAIKLMAFGTYVFLIVRNQPAQAISNVVFFMVVYTLFTAIEIGFLYHHISR